MTAPIVHGNDCATRGVGELAAQYVMSVQFADHEAAAMIINRDGQGLVRGVAERMVHAQCNEAAGPFRL